MPGKASWSISAPAPARRSPARSVSRSDSSPEVFDGLVTEPPTPLFCLFEVFHDIQTPTAFYDPDAHCVHVGIQNVGAMGRRCHELGMSGDGIAGFDHVLG